LLAHGLVACYVCDKTTEGFSMRYAILFPALALLALTACNQSYHAEADQPTNGPAAVTSGSDSSASPKDSGNPFRVVNRRNTVPGVLKFSRHGTYRAERARTGRIMALYPVTLDNGVAGHLIVVDLNWKKYINSTGLYSVAQPDVDAFTLHKGERIVLVGRGGKNRVLP